MVFERLQGQVWDVVRTIHARILQDKSQAVNPVIRESDRVYSSDDFGVADVPIFCGRADTESVTAAEPFGSSFLTSG